MRHWRGKLLVPLESLNEANSLKWIFSFRLYSVAMQSETSMPAHLL